MPGNPANMQAMANDPAELIRILEEASFLPPDQYDARLRELRQLYQAKAEFPIIPQLLDEKTDPRRSIVAAEIEQSANMLVGFAEKSRTDGHLLWGRIQGTEYELAAHRWIRDELTRMGLQDVHYVEMACQLPQWTPSKIALDISYSPEGKAPQTFSFDSAITAFISATTDDGGVSGEVVYAGEGTAAELNGRDLNGKVVLLKARTLSSALLSTARTAYSRIATGKWGMPRGVIVWWDVPFAKQIAGRVGAPGGADDIGLALPWTSIGYTDGLYLRKLLDRHPTLGAVTAKLIVQGTQEPPSSRTTANTYAILPGTEDQYIVIPTHVDGYFYGLHDNGGAVSINLALAKYFSSLPPSQRRYGIIFLFQGDHEVPGVGGTLPFIKANLDLMTNHLLLVLRPEHHGMTQFIDEGVYFAKTNVASPLMVLVTNLNTELIRIFTQASTSYTITTGEFIYQDPAADEAAFHHPYNDIGAVSTGYIQTGTYYHSTADVDLGGVDFTTLEKMARAYAYIIEELFALTKAQIHKEEAPVPSESIYSGDLIKIIMGDN